MFDVEYGRWQEEHSRLMYELRAALQQQLPEGELQMYVESCLAHHDEVLAIKDAVIKADVFHLISGVWRSPAERCFLWLGGFRPSEIIKVRTFRLCAFLQIRLALAALDLGHNPHTVGLARSQVHPRHQRDKHVDCQATALLA